MTLLRQLVDHRLGLEAVVTAINPPGAIEDDDRPSLTLSETLFQDENDEHAADRGTINDVPIDQVLRSPTGEVSHHFAHGQGNFRVGQRVRLKIDHAWRQFIARMQCAGKLIELAGQEAYLGLWPIFGRCKPHQGCVTFGGESFPSPDEMTTAITPVLRKFIDLDLPIAVTGDPKYLGSRRVHIGEFQAFPCGGVYPRSASEVGDIVIWRIHAVGGRLRVHYTVPAARHHGSGFPNDQVAATSGDALPSPYGLYY